jgi:transposase
MGIRLPSCSPESFVSKVRKELLPFLASLLTPFLVVIESLCEQIEKYEEHIHRIAREKYPETEVLSQIHGVGTLTALTFILTLGSAERFEHSRDVGAYLGLVPRRSDSGNRVTQLGITKTGDSLLRRLLVGSAQYMLTRNGRDCDSRRHGLALMERGGKNAKKRAVIAVARKLGVLMHHLWATGSHYDPNYNQKGKEVQSALPVSA